MLVTFACAVVKKKCFSKPSVSRSGNAERAKLSK